MTCIALVLTTVENPDITGQLLQLGSHCGNSDDGKPSDISFGLPWRRFAISEHLV